MNAPKTVAYVREKANAKLIAAAPQLVEALKKAIGLIEDEYCSHRGEHGADNRVCYAQEQYTALRAAGVEI